MHVDVNNTFSSYSCIVLVLALPYGTRQLKEVCIMYLVYSCAKIALPCYIDTPRNDGKDLCTVKISIWCLQKHWISSTSCYDMTTMNDLQLGKQWNIRTSVSTSCIILKYKKRDHVRNANYSTIMKRNHKVLMDRKKVIRKGTKDSLFIFHF
jgi:hypothetical protein